MRSKGEERTKWENEADALGGQKLNSSGEERTLHEIFRWLDQRGDYALSRRRPRLFV